MFKPIILEWAAEVLKIAIFEWYSLLKIQMKGENCGVRLCSDCQSDF